MTPKEWNELSLVERASRLTSPFCTERFENLPNEDQIKVLELHDTGDSGNNEHRPIGADLYDDI